MTIKKWAIPAGLAVAAIVAIGVGLALSSSGDDDGDKDATRLPEDAAECAEPPCDDVGVDGQATCLEGAEDCDDAVDPDEPVSTEPVTIIDGQDPNECNLVHNIDACERNAADAAVADLADRLQIDDESITVVSSEFVEWPDSCVGIQRPGVACAEVITIGFRILLDADGDSYEYHTDATASVVGLLE
jgi:hypothetical protein